MPPIGTTYDAKKLEELHRQRADLLAKSKQIVAKALGEQRELYPEENETVEAAHAKIAEIDPELKAQGRAMVKAVMSLGGAEDVDPDAASGPFDEAATSGFLNAIRSKTAFRAVVPRDGMHTKAAITGGMLPTSGTGAAPALYPNAGPVAVTSLMPNVPVDGPTVRYYQIGSGTAGVVAEGAAKPDSGITATAKDVALVKIAALLKVSDELSQDAPWMLQYLQQALIGAVVSKENEECVSTMGATSGILTATGTAADAVDVFADAIASMQALGTNPSAILVTPATLATIRKAKAETGGTYVTDPLAAGPATLHGVPLYAVPVSGAGVGWVIDGTGLAYYRRSQVTFELGHDADDWSHNLQTGRAETRGKCGVLQPKAVTKVTLT